jgi:serine/threonine-protein phosphatase 2A activator
MNFIKMLQNSVKGKSNSQVPKSNNPCFLGLEKLFDELDKLFDEVPLSTKEQRFGNTAFKLFRDKVEKQYDTLIKLVVVPKFNEGLALELKNYLLECFGSYQRLDYGTGHELNFLCFLLVLFCCGFYQESDLSAIVVHIFFRYIAFVRKIQVHFHLEPAGAHGVWGLDEYQFLSFLIGSAQLIDNPNITPSQAIEDDILDKYKDEFMYLSCIKHIKTVKHGGSFGEYAPLLYSITGVANWEKVAKGLVKMYEDEVLKKFVVVQHFYFGSILVLG